MEDLERFKKPVFKLFILLYFDVFAIQPNFLACSIAMTLYSFIMGFILQFLYME